MPFLSRLWHLLIDFKTTTLLLLLFAVAIAVATFIENDYGSDTAKALIYQARWLEVLYLLLSLNLIGNIIRLKLWRRGKRLALLFHAAFLVILLGAAITRYFGYEGTMHIRQGESENRLISSETYLRATISRGSHEESYEWPMLLSALGTNNFNVKAGDLAIELVRFQPSVERQLIEAPDGKLIMQIMVSDGHRTEELFLEANQTLKSGGIELNFHGEENLTGLGVHFFLKDGIIHLSSPEPMRMMEMDTQRISILKPGFAYPLRQKSLYTIGQTSFIVRAAHLSGKVELKEKPITGKGAKEQALTLRLTYGGATKELPILGTPGTLGTPVSVKLADATITLEYGAKIIELPFSLKLDEFILTRYPGSDSPSSYESRVVVEDPNGSTFPYAIYMNHVLDYKGYRFFQSSYDPDELGTILSVSHDPGKWPTYLGYLLLSIGMLANLFNPASRFGRLAEALRTSTPALALVVLLATSIQANAIENEKAAQEAIKIIKSYDPKAADAFSELLVQDMQGRIKPIDTLAREVVAKVSRNADLFGLSPNQIILGMITRPQLWQEVKMIRIGHPGINKALGIPEEEKMAAFSDFFDYNKPEIYKLKMLVEEANRKRPALRDKFDTELLKVDERVNICYMVYTGMLLRIIPKPGDPKQQWYNPAEAIQTFDENSSEAIRAMMAGYFTAVDEALASGDWSKSYRYLSLLATYQKKAGADIYPPETRIQAELLYNKTSPFESVGALLGITGVVLFIFAMIQILKPSPLSIMAISYGRIVLWVLFGLYTGGLVLRWYIAGHAPWSDGYESMLYIGWATLLATQIFGRYSPMVPGVGALMSGVILFVAHLGWLDPQITNLVPVLKSYWLNIHVSMITASYGFLGLGSLLGAVTLLLFTMRSPTKPSVDEAIMKLLKIDEMALIAGLTLLTIGNFLGGVWANESWGRYWGWDPKETWALVTILVYAAVIHQRFIPGANTPFAFAVTSTVAIASVIMTYFGVNYYLTGLHSYAAGDPIPVPMWVYVTTGAIIVLILLAARKRDMPIRI